MLHDPSHYEPPPIAEEIKLRRRDKDVLRRLAEELAPIAALPVHQEQARLWQKLNDLESERPMVWINEIPWHEMNVDDELTLLTEHPWARDQERELRRTLYQWRHLPGDMIRQRLPGLPAGGPQHRLRDHRRRGRGQDRRGQRHRLAALSHPNPRLPRPGENQDARGDAQRSRHALPLPGNVRRVRRHHAGPESSGKRTSGSRPGTTCAAGGASRRRCWT